MCCNLGVKTLKLRLQQLDCVLRRDALKLVKQTVRLNLVPLIRLLPVLLGDVRNMP